MFELVEGAVDGLADEVDLVYQREFFEDEREFNPWGARGMDF